MSDIELQRQIDKLKLKLDDLATRDRALPQPYGIPVFIPDAMVCDFNGLQPYQLDLMGIANGNLGQPATVPAATLLGNVIYRKGLFGKAVQIAESTTNQIPNPSFESNTGISPTSWTRVTAGTLTGFVGAVEATPYATLGKNAYHIQQPNAAGSIYIYTSLGSAAGVYTVSFNVEVISGTVAVRVDNSTQFPVPSAFLQITQSGRYSITFTNNGTGNNLLIMAGSYLSAVGIGEAYFDCIQLEAKAYATPYADGSMGSGYAWTGTANNSTSTRKASQLYYPANVIARQGLQGTIMAWMQLGLNTTRAIFDARSAALTGTWVVYTAGGFIKWRAVGSSSDLISAAIPALTNLNEWHHIALAFDYIAGEFRLYFDGALIGSYLSAATFAGIGQFNIGVDYTPSAQINGLIANLVISSRVLPLDAIRAVYLSNAPAYSSDRQTIEIWQDIELASGAAQVIFPEGTFSGEVMITNLNNRVTALYLITDAGTILIAQTTAANYSATYGNAGTVNVDYDGSTGIAVQNNLVSTTPFAIRTRRMPVQGLAHP